MRLQLRGQRLSVDDLIILVGRNPILGEAMAEARLHHRAPGYVEDSKQDTCSLFVTRQGHKRVLHCHFNSECF